MTPDLIFAHSDLSRYNGYSGNGLDRLGEKRESLDLAPLLQDERAVFYVLCGQRQMVKKTGPFDFLFTCEDVLELGGQLKDACLLGLRDDGTPEFALEVPRQETYPNDIEAVDLRTVTRAGLLVDEDVGALAQARSLVLWHKTHQFCACCGAKTEMVDGGYARLCPSCGAKHFPRTDPVVIMLAVDGDHCLLGRSVSFPEKMMSCLAGFVEVGETAEEAVRRELFEESGIRSNRVRYHSSQPWPFPSSLMIGFFAEATSRTIVTDDELELCRWFSREETADILQKQHAEGFWAPPGLAIAHQLMRSFVFGLPD